MSDFEALNPSEMYSNFLDVPMVPQSNLWTQIEEDGKEYIISGYQKVNAVGYYVTQKPWDKEMVIEI